MQVAVATTNISFTWPIAYEHVSNRLFVTVSHKTQLSQVLNSSQTTEKALTFDIRNKSRKSTDTKGNAFQ